MTAVTAQPTTMARTYRIGTVSLLLLAITVMLGLTLGLQTRDQFREIELSWTGYSGGVEQRGVWISSIRGYLGYGGIIHNFKNYVLRKDEGYFEEAASQIAKFNSVVGSYLEENIGPAERNALETIAGTIGAYETGLGVARRAIGEGLPIARIDERVRIDDTEAVAALAALESIWETNRHISTQRILAAVERGDRLIWIGFASLAALVLAALALGFVLFLLLRDLGAAILQLSSELTARRKLEQSERRLTEVVEQSPATIFITDTDARILYANRRFEELTGWSRAEVEGETPHFLQSGDTPDDVYEDIKTRLKRGEGWSGVFRNRRKDGGSYWAETTIMPLMAPDGSVQNFMGIGEDVTEKRQAREHVARAQKLEVVGQLAGGIAHDFNNILSTILGATYLAQLDAKPGSDLAGEIEQIDIAARRGQSLVRGLLTFARRQPQKPEPTNLSEIVNEVVRLLRASIPASAELTIRDVKDDVWVLADRTHLHQIVMNLCRNAAEAIGTNDGTVEVRLEPAGSDPGQGLEPRGEGWVRMTISDNGPGMSASTRAHAFDPFFTTKPIGKGSGLGLAVVSGLIDDIGGSIHLESEPGAGACFTVVLPATGRQEANPARAVVETPRGHEHILLVDDQPAVAGTLRRILLRLGYFVDAYVSPETALEKFLATPDRHQLLITDMVMPKINGEELIRLVREQRPGLPVIVCSAFTHKGISVSGAEPHILPKPVDPAELGQVVRRLLDEAGGASG